MRRLFLAVSLVLLLPGCLNYEQNTRLEEDGSGSMDIHYWISESVFMWMKDGKLAFNEDSIRIQYEGEGIEVLDARTDANADDSTRHVRASLKFDDIRTLPSCRGFADLSFVWQSEGDVYRFEQHLPASTSSAEDLLAGYTFTYTYEFPGTIRESNADSVDGNRAVWVVPLSELDKDVEFTATVEASAGANVYWVLGVIAVVVVLIVVVRKARKKG
jgi:hypothetical protein